VSNRRSRLASIEIRRASCFGPFSGQSEVLRDRSRGTPSSSVPCRANQRRLCNAEIKLNSRIAEQVWLPSRTSAARISKCALELAEEWFGRLGKMARFRGSNEV